MLMKIYNYKDIEWLFKQRLIKLTVCTLQTVQQPQPPAKLIWAFKNDCDKKVINLTFYG